MDTRRIGTLEVSTVGIGCTSFDASLRSESNGSGTAAAGVGR